MTDWIDISQEVPRENQTVFTWSEEGMKVCVYKKVLTWTGYKLKFCNKMSKWMIVDEKVTHWMSLPKPPVQKMMMNQEVIKMSMK